MAEQATGPKVLDVAHAALPNPHLTHFDVTGFDRQQCTDCGYDREVQGDIADIRRALQGEVFNTILCGEFIEHVEDPYSLLRNLNSLLDKNGKLVLSTPNPLGFPAFILEVLRNQRFFYASDHTYYFLPRWVDRMLTRTGFQVTNIIPVGLWCGNFVLPTRSIAMSYQVIYVAEHAKR